MLLKTNWLFILKILYENPSLPSIPPPILCGSYLYVEIRILITESPSSDHITNLMGWFQIIRWVGERRDKLAPKAYTLHTVSEAAVFSLGQYNSFIIRHGKWCFHKKEHHLHNQVGSKRYPQPQDSLRGLACQQNGPWQSVWWMVLRFTSYFTWSMADQSYPHCVLWSNKNKKPTGRIP